MQEAVESKEGVISSGAGVTGGDKLDPWQSSMGCGVILPDLERLHKGQH